MRTRRVLLAPLLALALSGVHTRCFFCAGVTAPTLAGDTAIPVHQGLGRYQALLRPGSVDQIGDHQQGISEFEWRGFLDREVTPRLSGGPQRSRRLWPVAGKNQTAPERFRSKMLIIDYPDSEENRDKIEAIRAAWKRATSVAGDNDRSMEAT